MAQCLMCRKNFFFIYFLPLLRHSPSIKDFSKLQIQENTADTRLEPDVHIRGCLIGKYAKPLNRYAFTCKYARYTWTGVFFPGIHREIWEFFFFHTGNKWSAKSLCLHYPRIFAKDNYLNSQADEVTYINSQKTAYWSFYLANIYALFHSNIVLSALNNMTCFKLHCYCASIIICIWWHAFCDQISFGSRQFFFRPSPSSSIFIYLFLFIFIYLFIFLSLFIFPSLSSSSALPNKKKKRK